MSEMGGGGRGERKEVGKKCREQKWAEVDGGESEVMEAGNVRRRHKRSREGRKTFGVGRR